VEPAFTVVIPARMRSTRLPGKMLADIGGKPLVAWVAERAKASGAKAVCIATDHDDIARAVTSLGWQALKTSEAHETGTDRLAEAAAEVGFEPVPALFDCDTSELPTGLEETHHFLLSLGDSRCRLDDEAAGVPEGVVVRSPDRSRIAKLRREDYERTLRRRPGKK